MNLEKYCFNCGELFFYNLDDSINCCDEGYCSDKCLKESREYQEEMRKKNE